MAATSIYGLDYPVPTDLVTNLPAQMQLLAGDTETALNTQVQNLLGRNQAQNALMHLNYRNSQSSFVCDRWLTTKTAGATVTWVRSTLTTPDANLPQTVFAYANATITVAGAAGDYVTMGQNIENVSTLAGRTVKVSFYAKTLVAPTKLGVSFDQNFGTGGAPSATVQGTGQSVTLTTTWARYTMTFSVPSIAGKTIGTAGDDFLLINFWLSAGTTFDTRSGSVGNQAKNIWITGVQVEGEYVTPLEVRPDAIQEALCGRYFQTSYQQGVYLSAGGAGVAAAIGAFVQTGSTDGGGFMNFTIPLTVPMFKVPTPTFYTLTAGTLGSWDFVRTAGTTTLTMVALGTGSGRKALGCRNNVSSGATWASTLGQGHWVCDTGW